MTNNMYICTKLCVDHVDITPAHLSFMYKRFLLLFLCINHNHIFMSFLATNVLGFIHSYCQIFLIIYSMNRSERHAKKSLNTTFKAKHRVISFNNIKLIIRFKYGNDLILIEYSSVSIKEIAGFYLIE